MESALTRYFENADGLSRRELADRLSVGAPAISKWAQRGVPAERVLDVERETGVSRHILRPDVFGPVRDVAA